MAGQLSDCLSNFLRFLRQVGAVFDERLISFAASPIHGWGVIARKNIKPGTVVAVVPKSAVLSVETATLWQHLNALPPTAVTLAPGAAEGDDPEDVSQHRRDQVCPPLFQLPAAVLFEALLGERSRWAAYIDILPRSMAEIAIPLAENDAVVRRVCQGTAVDVLTVAMRDKLKTVFDRVVKKLLVRRARDLDVPHHVAAAVEFEQFALAFAWVTSRAFKVDNRHGTALVPIADMFNHRTDGEHVHINGEGDQESDVEDDDDDIEGEGSDSDGSDRDDNDGEHGKDEDVESEGPVKRVSEHENGLAHVEPVLPPTSATMPDARTGGDGPCHRHGDGTLNALNEVNLQEGINNARSLGKPPAALNDNLEITCVRHVGAGQEVFNTFGQKSNTLLFLNYGFTEPDNSHDTGFIHVDDVKHVLQRFFDGGEDPDRVTPPARKSCIESAETIVFSDVLDDFFQILSDGTFCHGLMIFVYLHLAPWSILEPFCDDDLALMEHLMSLSLRDILKSAGPKQIFEILADVVDRQESKFPSGSNLVCDEQTLTDLPANAKPLEVNALRVRVGQRKALQIALEKLRHVQIEICGTVGAFEAGSNCEVECPESKRKRLRHDSPCRKVGVNSRQGKRGRVQ